MNELYHYGVKGMKWGVRRTREELDESYRAGIMKRKLSELPNGLPRKWFPNSTVDKVDDDGKILQRRRYGADGLMKIDYDLTDHNRPDTHPTGAHKHILDVSKKNPHGDPMKLTFRELRANSDIIERGRNYFDKK